MTTIDLYELGQTIDQYKIVRLIAKTQNSHIFLVEASGLHKHFVLKLFAGEISPVGLKRFVDQANLSLEFVHQSHIVNVMHLGYADKRPYLVMPYYSQTLSDLLAVHYQKISFLTSLAIIKQILIAVQSLHHLGVVHLDIKPQNVFLDEANNVALADFDNAEVLPNSPLFEKFQSTADLGKNEKNEGFRHTAEYASPEQINRMSGLSLIDESSDLYSIGALWFRILVGESLSSIISKDVNNAKIDEAINVNLMNVAPQWARKLIADLLHISTLKRPACTSCLAQIEQHVQMPSSNQTLLADASQILPFLSKLQKEIEQILLVDGWVSQSEQTRLLATYRLLEVKPKDEDAENSSQSLHNSLQLVIEECEQQLIQDHHMSAWFGWINYVKILLAKSGASISPQQYEQVLTAGRAARPNKPELADAFLKKHFTIQKKPLNLAYRFFLPIIIIGLVFFYWTMAEVEELTSAKEIPQFDLAANKVSADKLEFTLTPSPQIPQSKITLESAQIDFKDPTKNAEILNKALPLTLDKISTQTGTYDFVVGSGITTTTVVAQWVKVKSLPDIRIMSTEVTNALYSICVTEGACRQTRQFSTEVNYSYNNKPENELEDTLKHPKANLTWYEITEQFIPWINRRTDKHFALPSYQQWLAFSQVASVNVARSENAHCKNCTHPLARQYKSRTMPVSAINADLNGMYHVFGNVQEWLSDCWQQQSVDGRHVKRCDQAMVVGGSWMSLASNWQNGDATQLLKTAKTPTTGFRLVELLNE